MNMLEVKNLKASIGEIQILNGVDLNINKGELHAIMGPNGSGKSTLCHVLMGNTEYKSNGSVMLNDVSLLDKEQFERSKAGIFQSFQYPQGLPGVSLYEFIKSSNPELDDEIIYATAEKFNVKKFLERDVNVDLSGGEKKRAELFQLALKKPKLALLDEIDSGLDIDAIKTVANLINENRDEETSYLLVTHYSRILKYLKVDKVHIVVKGNVVKSGGEELIEEVDSGGYTQYQEA